LKHASEAAPPSFDATRVRGVVFDLDGTLIDSYAAITESLNHARDAFGLEPLDPGEVRRAVGHGLESLVAERVSEDRVEDAVRLFRERYAEIYAEKTVALPGVAAALRALHGAGLALSVASNKPERFSSAILRDLDLLRWIAFVAGPDTVGTTKPEPTMIRTCLERTALTPREALYVGDMVLDVETAARAGVSVVLVRGGSSTDVALSETGQRTIDSVTRLPSLLAPARRGSGC
jgi:phosphoglycolate phosphatase